MKADLYGRPSEQSFARMGWASPRVAKALGMKPCHECHFWKLITKNQGGGEFICLSRCLHPWTFGTRPEGQATLDKASCNEWSRKEKK
jgi:hypothetical protein